MDLKSPWILALYWWVSFGVPVSALSISERLAVIFDDGWLAVAWDGQPLTRVLARPAVSVTVDQTPFPGNRQTTIAAGREQVEYRSESGVLADIVEPFPAFPNCVKRRLTLTNESKALLDLTGADFLIAPIAPDGAPHWQAQSFVMIECAPDGPTLCVAFTSDRDRWTCRFRRTPQPIVRHHSGTAWRLSPNGQASIGTQYIWVIDGDLEAARASAQDWYDAVGTHGSRHGAFVARPLHPLPGERGRQCRFPVG